MPGCSVTLMRRPVDLGVAVWADRAVEEGSKASVEVSSTARPRPVNAIVVWDAGPPPVFSLVMSPAFSSFRNCVIEFYRRQRGKRRDDLQARGAWMTGSSSSAVMSSIVAFGSARPWRAA